MAETVSDVDPFRAGLGADVISAAAALSNEERTERLEELFAAKAAAEGEIVVHLGEVERTQSFREEGATSTRHWVTERFGVSMATARSLTQLGEVAWDLPHLVGALCGGEVSLDKLRAVAHVATPENDAELCRRAKEHSARELAEAAAMSAPSSGSGAPPTPAEQHERRSVRFNDTSRTVTAQLPADSYAETRACLEERAQKIPSDGETPWDQRLCDGFLELIRFSGYGASGQGTTSSPNFVVVHVPFDALVSEADEASELAAELERDGWIDGEAVQRIACDATVAIAVDDDVGHTMYEGRARRTPTDAQRREVMRRDRHCRFPGCPNVTFANVHHVVPWRPAGRTDLENLALLCLYHHHLVHSKGWTMSGNANEELSIVGPTGRVMASRPSPLWTRVTERARATAAGHKQ